MDAFSWRGLAATAVFLLAFSAMTAHGDAPAPETVILEVEANDQLVGQFFARLMPDGDILIEREALRRARIVPAHLSAATADGYVSLSGLQPGLQVQADLAAGRLTLHIAPDWIEFQRITPEARRDDITPSVVPAETSGFLNYGLLLTHSQPEDHWMIPWDFGIHHGEYLFTGDFRSQSETKDVQRMRTQLSRDFPDSTTRLTVGDVGPRSFGTAGTDLLGGIAFERAFEMAPEQRTNAGLSTTITIDRPSTIEILENGHTLRRLSVDSGVVRLEDIVGLSGSGDITIDITDIAGNRRTIETPYYISTRVLKPGLNEFGYFLGSPRVNLGMPDDHYDNRTEFIGEHRYGLTTHLTVGAQWQVDDRALNGGPTINATLFGRASLSVLGTFSRRDGVDGAGGRMDVIAALSDNLRVSASIEGFDRRYATLTIAPGDDKVRTGFRTNLSYDAGPRYGNFSVGAASRDNWLGTDERTRSLRWQRTIGRSLSLALTAALNESAANSYMAYLIYTAPGNHANFSTATLARTQTGAEPAADTLDLRSRFPQGPGYWYDAQARSSDSHHAVDVGGGARLSAGTLMLGAGTSDGADSYSGSFAGGLAITADGIRPTRTITDSFAVVNAGLPDIPVRTNGGGETRGRTGADGRMVIPDLPSYGKALVTLDVNQMPLNYSIADNTATLRIMNEGRRWGALVNFPIKPFTAVEGNLFFSTPDGPLPLDNARLSLQVDGQEVAGVTGEKGYFYFENLAPGAYKLQAAKDTLPCSASLVVSVNPNPASILQNLGDLQCVP